MYFTDSTADVIVHGVVYEDVEVCVDLEPPEVGPGHPWRIGDIELPMADRDLGAALIDMFNDGPPFGDDFYFEIELDSMIVSVDGEHECQHMAVEFPTQVEWSSTEQHGKYTVTLRDGIITFRPDDG